MISRPAIGAALLLPAATGFVLLLFLVRGEWGPLRRMDQAVADGLNEAVTGHGVMVRALRVVTDLGGSPALSWVTSVGVVWLLLRRQVRAALYVVAAAVGAWVLISVVKALVGRLRPVVDEPLATPSGLSFPSGHALSSLVSYGVLLLVFLPAMNQAARRVATTVAVVVVVLVGFTRIALGVHYLSDVVAGWLLGAVWLAVTAVAFRHWPHERLLGHPLPRAAQGGAVERSRVPSALPVLGSADELRPVPERHPRALPRPLVAAAELLVVWLLVLGTLYGLGVVVKGAGAASGPPGWDRALVHALADARTPWLNDVAEGLRILGGAPGIVVAVAVVGPLAVAVTRSWRPLALLALALVGQVTLFLVTVALVARDRPDVPHLNPELPPTASFPSGHVTATLALTACTAIIVFRATGHRGWRVTSVVLAVVITTAVAFERLYAGAHYPSDVLASLVLAGPWTAACWWATRPVPEARAVEQATRDPAERS
ncbi:putative membrane-associated phospholipid phosphatase [Streptomyces viridochromogenes Tue57]|uniref:Putative membrane-associated phospholipid phosphatase n=2 Tax=Streptomyces viridochromogenes TaxID=1938 RepID=L8P419_STRVR|nr:putative membrane-associated phospholipid phosphatase [Streptomyces viridochromogenes Tue57]